MSRRRRAGERWDFIDEVFQSNLDDKCRHLLHALGWFRNEQFEAWPSLATLCHMTGISRRSVHTHLHHLVDHGWLVEVDRDKRMKAHLPHRWIVKIPSHADVVPIRETEEELWPGAQGR